MWREELFHPLLAHFAVALLPVALIFRLTYMGARKRSGFAFLLPASRLLIVLGTIAAWAAVFTGGIAEDVVNKVICDPTVTHDHEELADWTAYGATLVALIELALWRWNVFFELKWPRLFNGLRALSICVLLATTACLVRTAHLGSTLVYQQGAAVYHPTEECKEFE